MNKQVFIIATSLILVNPLNAAGKVKEEHCFRPIFQKKLKRVKPIGLGSFRSGSLKQNRTRKAVFIDWRKLYWGRLSDLIYGEEEAAWDEREGTLGTSDVQEPTDLSADTEDTRSFASELRKELKAFARHYGLKIVWRKKPLELPDATDSFLDYWDKDETVESTRTVNAKEGTNAKACQAKLLKKGGK